MRLCTYGSGVECQYNCKYIGYSEVLKTNLNGSDGEGYSKIWKFFFWTCWHSIPGIPGSDSVPPPCNQGM